MGCKHGSRSSAVCRATSIPEDVLQEKWAIKDVGLLEKMAWAVGRETTKAPDQAYCLLGILGVSMEPDYNESGRKRLQKILVQTYPQYALSFGRFASLSMIRGRHRLAPKIINFREKRKSIAHRVIKYVCLSPMMVVLVPSLVVQEVPSTFYTNIIIPTSGRDVMVAEEGSLYSERLSFHSSLSLVMTEYEDELDEEQVYERERKVAIEVDRVTIDTK
jgi:hypothetical protein